MGTPNTGTFVIDKIVTPNSDDLFPTHDQDTNKGGYRSVQTETEMLAITTLRRTDGMEVRVVADADPTKNGRYVLQPDLTTFLLQDPVVLGTPPAGGWGTTASDPHTLTGVESGDDNEVYVDKILKHLDLTAPLSPATIDTLNLIMANIYSANLQGQGGSHVQANNIQILVQPVGSLDAKFGDARAGIVIAEITGVDSGNKTLTDGPAGDDDGIFSALTLANEEVFNAIFQRIDASIKSGSALALNNVQHNYKILHGILFAEIDFYVDDPVQPNVISISLIGVSTSGLFISGVPALDVGDDLDATFTITGAVSWFYNLLTFGRVKSAYATDADTGLVTGKNNGDNVVFTNFQITVIDAIYTEDADVDIEGYNSRFGTPQEIPADTGTSNSAGTSGTIRIDTVSDETIRVTSGAGQFPVIGGGAAGQPFNSTTTLDTVGNEELQLINGKFIYPISDFTGNNPVAGPDYTSVPIGSFNGIRFTTFNLGAIVALTSFEFDILGLSGFNGNPIETGAYSLQVKVDGVTGWLDANVFYPGVGDPVNDGDAALDVAGSTISHKRVTFGITPRSGTLYVRIGWAVAQIREITSIQ